MGLMDRLGRASDTGLVVRNERHRSKLVRKIEDRLVDLETTDAPSVEIQPLIQVCAAGSYISWRNNWEKAWRKKQVPWSTASWPPRLSEGELAALLVPVSAGRVGTALGKYPRPIAEPVLIVGRVADDRQPQDIALAVVAQWLTHTAQEGYLSAPPVTESIVRDRVDARAIVDFGVKWSLPAPDGL